MEDEEESCGGVEISFDSQLNELTSTEQNDTHNVEHTCGNFGAGEIRRADVEGSVNKKTK